MATQYLLPNGTYTTNLAEYQRAISDVGNSSTGTNTNTSGDLFDRYDKTLDSAFRRQKEMMGLTNEFRTREGATQGQMDQQAFRRLSAELETRKYMQNRGQELANWQRDQDRDRAMASFRNIGR